ncbi:hypothetical protein EUGRSUZ_I01408 [Eucalyptus grandis]|uniref:Uncharacterized protein n=2 Tax=Eucalyptus grandis TaxID=71139 RepID=A0ACC3JFQ4_EUCGR|nr:hypothetical protein EUGRSUZ_I01408 [Eucalyptus grandis]
MALPVVDTEYLKEIDKARRHLRALIAYKNCAPIMLRLAWHDAGTYDARTKTGGPTGSIRNEEEYSHGANAGLKIALDFCEDVKSKCPRITYADLYQLAGVVAVEVTGGPTIDFVPGRKDSRVSPNEGRLPDANQGPPHLRDIFYRMGLSDKDIVALSGAHTLVISISAWIYIQGQLGMCNHTCYIFILVSREGHTRKDLDLMVLGLRNPLSLIIPILSSC